MPRIWIPTPASKAYGSDAMTVRDRLVQAYGADDVFKMEVSVVLDVMILTGMLSPTEFMEVMVKKLQKLDDARREHARLERDSG